MSQELVVAPGSQASHRVTGLQVGEPSSHMPSLGQQGPSLRGLSTKHTPKLRLLLLRGIVCSMPATPHVFSFNLFNLPDQPVKQITNPHSSHEEAVLREVKLSTNIGRFII